MPKQMEPSRFSAEKLSSRERFSQVHARRVIETTVAIICGTRTTDLGIIHMLLLCKHANFKSQRTVEACSKVP